MVAITRKGLVEGNYTSWTKKWIDEPAGGLYNLYTFDALIDEKNDTLSISYKDSSSKYRFGIYNLSDFSAVYESPAGSYYTYSHPTLSTEQSMDLGMAYQDYGGLSQSLQTYLLLLRSDEYTLEVWRGGSSALWSRNTRTDYGATCYCYTAGISLLGKYVLAGIRDSGVPGGNYLMLYEGQ